MAVGIDCELGCSQQLGDEALIPETRLIVSWDTSQQFDIVFYLLWIHRSLLKGIFRLSMCVCICVCVCCDVMEACFNADWLKYLKCWTVL